MKTLTKRKKEITAKSFTWKIIDTDNKLKFAIKGKKKLKDYLRKWTQKIYFFFIQASRKIKKRRDRKKLDLFAVVTLSENGHQNVKSIIGFSLNRMFICINKI